MTSRIKDYVSLVRIFITKILTDLLTLVESRKSIRVLAKKCNLQGTNVLPRW